MSDYHVTPVPAAVHGSFKSYWNAANNSPDVWYCVTCAATGQALGLFTPDNAA